MQLSLALNGHTGGRLLMSLEPFGCVELQGQLRVHLLKQITEAENQLKALDKYCGLMPQTQQQIANVERCAALQQFKNAHGRLKMISQVSVTGQLALVRRHTRTRPLRRNPGRLEYSLCRQPGTHTAAISGFTLTTCAHTHSDTS